MSEDKITELLNAMFSRKITKKSYGSSGTYETNVVDSDGKIIVEQIIRAALLDNRDERIGILEAKVFMYEEIISKSTFAPMIAKPRTTKTSKQT